MSDLVSSRAVGLGGDFRQVLHVVEGGTIADIIVSFLIRSTLWQHVTVLRLRKNMRLPNSALSDEEPV